MKPKDGQVGTVILYDKGFHIQIGSEETGVRHGVTIENLCRHVLETIYLHRVNRNMRLMFNHLKIFTLYYRALTIKCSTYRQARWWGHSIDEFVQRFGQDFLRENRHGSFAPVRENTKAQWWGTIRCRALNSIHYNALQSRLKKKKKKEKKEQKKKDLLSFRKTFTWFQTSCFTDQFSQSVRLSIYSVHHVPFNMSLSSWLDFFIRNICETPRYCF